MKLVSFDDGKIGLLILLPGGPHVVDIAASIGVFAPHDPLANGILNGSFKEGGNWSKIVNHWAYLKLPLRKLTQLAEQINVQAAGEGEEETGENDSEEAEGEEAEAATRSASGKGRGKARTARA